MFRKLIPLAIAIALGVTGAGGRGDDKKVESDPNATFTIKLRQEQAGDKREASVTETSRAEVTLADKTSKQKDEKRFVCIEHIIDMPAKTTKPTKLTREYKTAQKFDEKANAFKATSYEGKTVTIEKKGTAYEFTVEGKKLELPDSVDFNNEFNKGNKDRIEAMLPKKAVKVGESWPIDPEAVKSLGSEIPFDATKSKMTGKLTGAYTKDGKQWGIIAFDFDLVVASPEKAKQSVSGTIKINGTLDAVIDGTASEGTMKTTIKMNVISKEGGGELKIVADMTQEKTIKTVK